MKMPWESVIEGGMDIVKGFLPKRMSDAEKAAAEVGMVKLKGMLENGVMKMKSAIIIAEAKGGSWLQRNWRPMLMCLFGIIIANNYIIYPYVVMLFGVENAVKMDIPPDMWDLLKLGVSGYIVGRSVEKAVKSWKDK